MGNRKNWTYEKIFTRLIKNRSRTTYWDSIRELRKRPNKDVYARAVELCNSEIDKEKIIGSDVLAQLGYAPRFNQEATIDLYFKLLEDDQSPKVLVSIFSGISHNNENLTNDQVLKLIQFQDHHFLDVRCSLAQSLSGVENEDAINTLINLSRDQYPEVRDWATFALGSQVETTNDKIVNALWDRIKDEHTYVRHEAIAGLAARKDKKIKGVIIRELEEIDDHGSLILESIEALDDKDFVELLSMQIEKNKQTKKVNEKWLLNCIERLQINTQ